MKYPDKLVDLNQKILDLKHKDIISDGEFATYEALLDWLEFSTAHIGDRLPIKDSRGILEKLK